MRGSIVIGVALALALALTLGASACGEAGVQYQGVVIEDEKEARRWFDTAPAVGTPVPGAVVELCLYDGCAASLVYTDENGAYETDLIIFAGTLWSETRIEVRVTAPDGRVASYVTVYEETTDPTQIEEYCDEEECPQHFLNFQLGP